MRWRGLLLALALLLFPSPSHASDEGEKPAYVDEDAPDLPPDDLDAWKYYSIRARKLHHSGIAIVVVASALLVPGIVIAALEAVPADPGADEQGGGFGILLIGTPSYCAAMIGYAVGFGLLGKGWTEAGKARKLASGQLTAEDVGGISKEHGMDPARVQRFTTAGLVLEAGSLAILTGAWLSWTSYVASDDSYGGATAWMIMMPLALAFHGVGAPLILASHKGLRHTLGLKPWTSVQVAGWVFYALALATLPMYFAFMPPYLGIAGSAFTIIGAALSMTAGVHSRRLIDAHSEEQPEAGLTLMPFVSPLPGGMVAGIAGAF